MTTVVSSGPTSQLPKCRESGVLAHRIIIGYIMHAWKTLSGEEIMIYSLPTRKLYLANHMMRA